MKHILVLIFSLPLVAFAQNAGDNVFGTNQIVRVDLTFTQTGFWDSLVANYPTGTDMMAVGLQITDAQGVHVMDSIAIHLKGNSTYGHPGNKKSFKIDINQFVSGQDYDGLKKLNFNNGFKDPTFMREKLFFDLCNVLQVPAPRVNYANVYMNGTFWGFYGMVEQVDNQYLNWAMLESTGNLFKAGDNSNGTLPADLLYYGATEANYTGRYELKTNEVTNDWTDLIAFMNFINSSSTSAFETGFNTHIAQTNFIKSIVLDNLFSNLDSYINSGRNYYLYHNLIYDQWNWIKWDANEAFGTYNGGPGTGNLIQLAPNYVAQNRPLVSKLFANATLYGLYLDQMCSYMESHFNPAYMNAKIDALKTLIQNDVAADANKMYTTSQFNTNIDSDITVTGGMGNQTVFGLKSFVSQRKTYLSNLLSCATGVDELEDNGLISPNPFQDLFHLPVEWKLNSITDASGRKVDFKPTVSGSDQQISLNSKPGVYFLNLEKSGVQQTVKMLKVD